MTDIAPDETAVPALDAAAEQPRTAPKKPAPRVPSPALEKLFELYPKLFGAQFVPLKLGVFHDLLERHPEAFDKAELKLAMGQHARSTRYLQSVAAGLPRHDLDGNAIEAVSPEHVHHAVMEVFKRAQLRTREDLRPKLLPRLMYAIENSGLSLDEYAERMHGPDEAHNALLMEAIAELKTEHARREALLATFKASGLTLDAFCQTYGMNLAQVQAALAQAAAA
jgi:ProP effector